MANVFVNYEELAKYSQEWRNLGNDIYENISNLNSTLEQLNTTWYGNRFNELIRSYKESAVPLFQQLVDAVYTQIPYWANTAAKGYAQVNGEEISPILSEEQLKVMEPNINVVTGKFNIEEEKVQSALTTIHNRRDKILEDMNQIMTGLNNMGTWNSDAATKSRDTMKQLREQIGSALETMIEQINKYMNLALEDVQKAEQVADISGQM